MLDANTSRKIYGFRPVRAANCASSLGPISAPPAGLLHDRRRTCHHAASIDAVLRGSSFCLGNSGPDGRIRSKVFDFILGDRSNEGPLDDPKKYFRQRTSVLGDIVDSEAVYVSTSQLDFVDSGYDAFEDHGHSEGA